MENTAEMLFQYLRDVLYCPEEAQLNVDALPEDFKQLGEGMKYIAQCLDEARALSDALAKGKLSVESPSPQNELAAPLKALHASLRHLTWQSQQVAKGDYQQRVDFMGEFADAFNTMVQQLDHRQKALEEEIESGQQKAQVLEQSVDLFELVTARISQWIIVVDRESKRFLFTNHEAQTALDEGGFLAEDLRKCLLEKTMETIDANQQQELDIELCGAQGLRYFHAVGYPLCWRGHDAMVFVMQDVSDEKRRVLKLETYAYIDNLTQLYNRHYGMKELARWLDEGKSFCLCFVDLDNLKYVNDNFGHAEGDQYLKLAASTVQAFSSSSITSRIGGDEFMVLAPGKTRKQTEERMELLRQGLMEGKNQPPARYVRSISYGVVDVDKGGYTASRLLELADERMYKYKRTNKRGAVAKMDGVI